VTARRDAYLAAVLAAAMGQPPIAEHGHHRDARALFEPPATAEATP
jgi:hypothetical protein